MIWLLDLLRFSGVDSILLVSGSGRLWLVEVLLVYFCGVAVGLLLDALLVCFGFYVGLVYLMGLPGCVVVGGLTIDLVIYVYCFGFSCLRVAG